MRIRSAVAALALVGLLAPLLPAEEQDTGSAAPPSGTSALSGRIVANGGTPTVGATVIIYHLSTEQLFRSEPTDAKGGFAFESLPYGYFDVAVMAPYGLFVADAVVNVPPSGKTTVSLALIPGATEATLRTFPGTDQQPVGVATMARAGGKSFWSSAGGIAVIAGGGAVALAALASGGGSDGPAASPSAP